MNSLLEEIVGKLSGVECEIIESKEDPSEVMNIYEQARKEGKEKGFTPIILVPSETLLGKLEQSKGVSFYLEEAKKHQGSDILEGYLAEIKESLKKEGESLEDVIDIVERGLELDEFVGFLNEAWPGTLEVILAKIPTIKPWEVFAWVPMGDWNECPPTEYIIAIMKHWYESYGFTPVVITHEMIEGRADKKPQTKEEAVAIGTEHYAFCPDLIEQCCQDATIGQWADTLLQSYIWFFWWD